MKDSFGRTIDYLRLSVTDRCNYRCTYCMPEEGVCKRAHGDILSIEELYEIAAAAVRCGVKKIRLTGGEPLVQSDAVAELLKTIKAAGVSTAVDTCGDVTRDAIEKVLPYAWKNVSLQRNYNYSH